MPKNIIHSESLREKLLLGAEQLANAVNVTLGPKGRNVVLQNPGALPFVTNDGTAIAKAIELKDDTENLGARIIKGAALKTGEMTGVGATASIVLAQSIFRDGVKNIASGADPAELKRGIQGAAQLACAAIKKISVPVIKREVIAQVAAICAGDTAIGEMIAEAAQKLGKDGLITVEESNGFETTLKIMDGMQLDRGLLSPEMVTDKNNMAAVLEHPYILITDRKISNASELIPLLEQIKVRGSSLLIVAEGVEGEALGLLVTNKKSGILDIAAIHPPAYGDGRKARMEDLAILTGGCFICEDMGYSLRETTADMLGRAASVRADRRSTVIIGGAGDGNAVAERIKYIRMLHENSQYDFDKKQLEERLAKLTGGVAVISAGAHTETEMKEKKSRAQAALSAVKAAMAEGGVHGGGVAYLNVIPAVQAYMKTLSGDRRTGAAIILKALEEPARRIAENTGEDGKAIVARIKRLAPGTGFNAQTGEFVNMRDAGIIDPAKVARLALQNAASVSAMLMTLEAGVLDV